MIISIVTGGSRGDVQPYIALGKGLREAGHQVKLIASQDFETLVTDADLAFCSTGFSVESVIQGDDWRKIIENGNFLQITARMQKEMRNYARNLAEILPDLIYGTDWMITGVAGFGGAFSVAEKVNIPVIQAYVFPLTPTREYASPLTPQLPLGSFLNPPSFRAMQQMLWQITRSTDAETRRILGMEKASFWGPFQKLHRQRVPIIYGYSRHVVPKPADWDAHHHVTGYWFLDEAAGWAPPPEFVEFLNNGEAPVYIGFGSMINKNPGQVIETVIEALAISKQRGVLASGWDGMHQADLPGNVCLISSMPHSWLFPRMKVVVHHGGAGTTAAGLRAGVPSIIVPFMGDQAFWGHRIATLGVAPKPIPRKHLTAQRLALAIEQAISDTDMRQKASDMSRKIQDERGTSNAVDVVSRITTGSG
jgi:sterol 3beta-glucosyltransferase